MTQRIAKIKRQIESGTYLSPRKIHVAADRLAREIGECESAWEIGRNDGAFGRVCSPGRRLPGNASKAIIEAYLKGHEKGRNDAGN